MTARARRPRARRTRYTARAPTPSSLTAIERVRLRPGGEDQLHHGVAATAARSDRGVQRHPDERGQAPLTSSSPTRRRDRRPPGLGTSVTEGPRRPGARRTLHRRGHVHRLADGNERVRLGPGDEDQLHHRDADRRDHAQRARVQGQGNRTADLTWSAQSSNVDVYGTGRYDANDGLYTDTIPGKGAGTFIYKVCAAGSTTTCSPEVSVSY